MMLIEVRVESDFEGRAYYQLLQGSLRIDTPGDAARASENIRGTPNAFLRDQYGNGFNSVGNSVGEQAQSALCRA